MPNILRSATVAALLVGALIVHAADAYSNLDPAPGRYQSLPASEVGYDPSGGGPIVQGMQFTTVAGGRLDGFTVAMNDGGAAQPFTLCLYADSGSNTLGSLLGTYAGTSTGVYFASTTSALTRVAAAGPIVTLENATPYWLVATSGSLVYWNVSNSAFGPRYVLNDNFPNGTYLNPFFEDAYSVQVSPVPEPVPVAALGAIALIALRRRRRV